MHFSKSPIALAVLAVCSGLPLAAHAAPTVSWAAPLSGATLSGSISGSTCAVNASSDTTRVVFWANNYQINNDYSAPWNCSFNTKVLSDGSYTLKAVAYNDKNGTSTTASIPITIKNSGTTSTTTNTPPTVSISSPSAGQTVSGTSVAYGANASDNAGVSRVDFFLDGSSTALLSDSSSPYGGTLDTTKLANGSHTLSATAYDAAGLKSSTQVSFNVQNSTSTSTGSTGGTTSTATPAPFSGSLDVWYKAPTNGATIKGVLNGGTSCYANTSGSPARVVFTLDGKALNTDTTPADGTQCALDTTQFANGTHSMRADVYDASGNMKSDIISVNIQNPVNQPPTVSFGAPTAGQTVSGTAVAYAANAADDGGVAKVDFFLDGGSTALASDTAAPYAGTLDTTKLANGTHTLKATAYDAAGLNTSTQVSFNVQNSTSTGSSGGSTTTATPAPFSGSLNAWFKAPLSGATISGVLNGGTSCYVNASGPVARVVFSMDSTTLNTDSTPADGMQCVLDTTKFANGTHTMKAVAYDASGNLYNEVISVNVQNSGSSTGSNTGSGSTSGSGSTLPAGGNAVTTFHSAGLYWTPPSNPGSAGCIVQFRKQGDSTWRQGLNLWYDSRNSECRGSLVDLTPGTTYDVQLGVGSTYAVQTSATTWSEQFPIAQTVTVSSQSSTLNITQGGSASGYVLYQAAPGAVIDGGTSAQAINVNASYVIVRGFTVKGGNDGIAIQPGQHDVVVEQNDVSGWGRFNYTNSAGWQIGVDEDSGITSRCYNATASYRMIIQRNKVHDPRYGANSWDWGHPAGPTGISFYECGDNNVIRYNEITSSSQQHYYNDSIGGGNNDSNKGAPGADSDIYGNIATASMD
ncbi:MAG TPA: Ig-like domain-containing protein, partial [Burkholderiales bacterium]|nr:Ig-like domain-containing protein [Burkholderiales bacterium]